MRLKRLFTVPKGEKVTEKVFGRVLLSSICGILLCMACLASTTWAWFTMSIENEGNEIQIATVTSDVVVYIDEGKGIAVPEVDGSYQLDSGMYAITVQLENNATELDDLNRPKGNVYVVMIVTHEEESQSYYFTFTGVPNEIKRLEGLLIDGSATVSFSISWIQPTSAAPVGEDVIEIGNPIVPEPTDPSTEPTESKTTDPSEDDPTDPSDPSGDAPADPGEDPSGDVPADPGEEPSEGDPAVPSDPFEDVPADSGNPSDGETNDLNFTGPRCSLCYTVGRFFYMKRMMLWNVHL